MSNVTRPKISGKGSKIFTKLAVAANYFFERLAEASTMRAIIVLGSTFIGYTMDEGNVEYYIVLGVVLAQTIALFLPDKIEKRECEHDHDHPEESGK